MRKIGLLVLACFCLSACVKVTFSKPGEEKTQEVKKQKTEAVTFIKADRYRDTENEIFEIGQNFVKEHPTMGTDQKITVYYTGYVYKNDSGQYYALFMIANKTGVTIDRSASFTMNLTYQGQDILKQHKVYYVVDEFGVLADHTASVFAVPVTEKEQEDLLAIKEQKDFKLTIQDWEMKEKE